MKRTDALLCMSLFCWWVGAFGSIWALNKRLRRVENELANAKIRMNAMKRELSECEHDNNLIFSAFMDHCTIEHGDDTKQECKCEECNNKDDDLK